MKIVSLIRRPQGHVVTLDGVSYAFCPPSWGCEVTQATHVARFAAVPEGYRLEPDPLTLDPMRNPPAETPAQETSTEPSPPPHRRPRARKLVEGGLR